MSAFGRSFGCDLRRHACLVSGTSCDERQCFDDVIVEVQWKIVSHVWNYVETPVLALRDGRFVK